MSLIKCPKCGKMFSSHALQCPVCGLNQSDVEEYIRQAELEAEKAEAERRRIEEEEAKAKEEESRLRAEKRKEWWEKAKKKILVAITIAVLIIIGFYVTQYVVMFQANKQATDLIAEGDSLVNIYQFDKAKECYQEAFDLEPENEIKRKSLNSILNIRFLRMEANEEYEKNLRKLKILLEADDHIFNQYSNGFLDKMIQIDPNRPETIYYKNLRGK